MATVRELAPLDVGCPDCRVAPGRPCAVNGAQPTTTPHASRCRLAIEAFRAIHHLELGERPKPSELAPLELVPAGALRHALELARARCYRPRE